MKLLEHPTETALVPLLGAASSGCAVASDLGSNLSSGVDGVAR
jgi:hypothetical protein